MTVAGDLAGFLTRTRYEDIPPLACDYAAMLISSTIASAAMGSTLQSSRIVRDMLVQRGGSPEAQPWFGEQPMLPVASAARINALMSDAAASDDSDLRNITHPGTALAAASIAMAQKTGATGRDVLAAIALGYEAAGRINTGVTPGLIWEKGFHGCMITVFGAAAASGLLMKLSATQLAHALALAATSIGGLMAAAHTSTSREHHAGLAAMLGVEAAQLAGLGYTGEESVFEHPKGFFAVYGQDAHASGRVSDVTRSLGDTWEILTNMAIKLVPGGHPFHAVAEAAAQAARMAGVPSAELTSIRVWRPDARFFAGPRHPTDLIGMAHSPIFFAAAGAADLEFTWAHASPSKIMDPAIRRLLDLVEDANPPDEPLDRYRQGARVTVTTRQGGSFTSSVFAPRGSAINGIEWSDVERKFKTLCPSSHMSNANIEESMKLLRQFREVRKMRELVDLLA